MKTTPVPDDFNIVAAAGGLMAGSAQHVLEIDALGKGRFSAYESDEPGAERSDSVFTLNEAQLDSLWNTIQEQDFFSLDPQYAGEDVDDGSFASLTITAQGRTHRVLVKNRSVPRFERILNAINQMTPPDIELPYQGISGPD